jgi:proteasome lid subunit RPN8/RPN11
MKVKKELKKKIEALAHQCKPEEIGGYLLKNNRGVVGDFLPVPNIHSNPRGAYQPLQKGETLAHIYARSKGRTYSWTVEAFFHSHPTPCIMSAADLSYAQYTKNLTFVTLSPLGNGFSWDGYMWYACKGLAPEKIEFV